MLILAWGGGHQSLAPLITWGIAALSKRIVCDALDLLWAIISRIRSGVDPRLSYLVFGIILAEHFIILVHRTTSFPINYLLIICVLELIKESVWCHVILWNKVLPLKRPIFLVLPLLLRNRVIMHALLERGLSTHQNFQVDQMLLRCLLFIRIIAIVFSQHGSPRLQGDSYLLFCRQSGLMPYQVGSK